MLIVNLLGGASVSRRCLPCSRCTCGGLLRELPHGPLVPWESGSGYRRQRLVWWWVEWQLCLRHSLRPGESWGQLFHSPSWVERSRVVSVGVPLVSLGFSDSLLRFPRSLQWFLSWWLGLVTFLVWVASCPLLLLEVLLLFIVVSSCFPTILWWFGYSF